MSTKRPVLRTAAGLALLAMATAIPGARATEISSAGNGNWTNTATWSSGTIPGANDNVTILTNHTVTISDLAAHAVSNLTVNGGGTITHAANNTSETFKVILNVGGDLTIATNGLINVTGAGYAIGKGPAPGLNGNPYDYGASHGGLGGYLNTQGSLTPYLTYGSIMAPTNLGSGGTVTGGGAAILTVMGHTYLYGAITADGQANNTQWLSGGAGGSVWLTTATLAGSGTISAQGSSMGVNTYSAGGGRIAVRLTSGTDFDNVRMLAYASTNCSIYYGAAGTIYRETAAQTGGKGELIVDGGGFVPPAGVVTLVHPAIGGLPSGSITVQYGDLAVSNVTLVATNCAVNIHTNGAIELRSGSVLDLTGGTLGGTGSIATASLKLTGASLLTSPNFTYSNVNLWVASPSTFYPSNTFTISSNAVFTADAPLTFSNVTVSGGGLVTHSANNTSELFKVNFTILGDLTIATNGFINVTGKGYAIQKGPSPAGGNNPYYGGSHGGLGGYLQPNYIVPVNSASTPYFTYGCITAPTNCGSGGWRNPGSAGGGAAILTVTGHTYLYGAITADGGTGSSTSDEGSSGGSVWLTTASLAGSGTIGARGSVMATSSQGGGGGGRIAVELASGNSFDQVSMFACGTTNNTTCGAAGTVYTQTASQGPGNGTLVIDNAGWTGSGGLTLISSNVTGTTVGTVVIQNKAQFAIQSNCSFTVLSGFTNTTQTASLGPGSTLVVGGSNTCSVGGSNTVFYNLTCTNAGKTILFSTNTTFTVGGILTLVGGGVGSEITVDGASGSQWYLNASPFPNQHMVRYVNARYSNAGPGATIQAYSSVDSGNNSNWVFTTSGLTNAWMGLSNTTWGVNTNWSLGRAPVSDDYVLITNGSPRYPLLSTNVYVNVLDVRGGGSLSLNRYNLTVTNLAKIAGTLSATGTETVTIWKDADFTGGTFNAATSTVLIAGAGAQSLTFDNTRFCQLTVQNQTPRTFTGPFSATNFLNQGGPLTFSGQVAVGSFVNVGGNLTFLTDMQARDFVCGVTNDLLTFHAGSTYSITNLYLYGTRGNLIKLRSTSEHSTWKLNVPGFSHVFCVDVEDSDASAPGLTIYAVSSTNSTGNLNWIFGDSTWLTWAGSTSTTFTNANNWIPAVAPGSTNRILIDGNYINAPWIANSTVVAELAVGGYAPATLTVDAPLTVSGNMTILANGVLTHTVNGASELNKLNVTVATNLAIDAGGAIDVTGKGYAATKGPSPGSSSNPYYGGSHGGLGGYLWNYPIPINSASHPYFTYGCITAPTNCGSGGPAETGGGVAILNVASNTTINGTIRADGQVQPIQYNEGAAGGSVWLTTATLAGSGTISAKGTSFPNDSTQGGGGGGRIAVRLTAGESFGNVSMLAYETTNSGANIGGAGTVYTETASQGTGKGTLVIDNAGLTPEVACSTLISSNVTGTSIGAVLLRNSAKFIIDTNQWLSVSGSWTNDGTSTFTAYSNSTVAFTGASAAIVWGNNTFSKLSIGDPGIKPLTFEAGKTNTVLGDLAIYKAVLGSTSAGQWWYLIVTNNATQSRVRSVTVRDSNATNGEQIVVTRGGSDLGHNVNWKFIPASGTLISLR